MATQASNLSFIDNTQGQITISATTATTSTTTGALIIAGGVGIGGTVYVGSLRGDTTTSATTWGLFYNPVTKEITTATSGSGAGGISSTGTTSTFVISSTASSTSTNTGALQVVGGVGIGGSLFVGGVITATNFFAGTLRIDAGSTMTNLVVTGTATSTSTVTGAVVVIGGVGIGGTLFVGSTSTFTSTSSSTSTTTGALIVTGGVGIGGGVVVGGTLFVGSTSTFTSTASSTSTTTGALIVTGGVGIGGAVYIGTSSFIAGAQIITTATIGLYAAASAASTGTTGTFVISNTTGTVSTTTGALQVAGGVGIGGNLYVGGVITATNFFAGTLRIDAGSTMTNLVVTGTDTSTSTTTGAIVVAGGVGVSGNLNVGRNIARNSTTATTTHPLEIIGSSVEPTVLGAFRSLSTASSSLISFQNTSQLVTVFNTGSVLLVTASNQYLSIASNATLALGAGDFTVEGFYYLNTGAVPNQVLIDWRNGTNGGGVTQPLLEFQPTGSLGLNWYVNASNRLSSTNTPVLFNTWQHFAVSRVSGSTRMYLSGSQVGSTYADANNYPQGSIFIGANNDGGSISRALGAYVSNIRIIVGTGLYSGTTLTVPTVNLTSVTNTKLLLNTVYGANFLADSSGQGIAVTNNAAATSSAFAPFTGTGTTAYNDLVNIGSTGSSLILQTNAITRVIVDSIGTVTITSAASSTSTTTGALIVTGGVGIGGGVVVGGVSTFTNITIYSSTASSTSTTTGALIVTGGVGIGGNLYVASTSYIAGAQIITTATIGLYAAASAASTGTTSTFIISSIASSVSTTTGALQVVGGVGIGGALFVAGVSTFTNIAIHSNTTGTVSTNTGALQVVGGVGIGGGVFVGGTITATSFITSGVGSGFITGAGFISASTATITSTATSTSTTTGALIVTGGLGVGGNIYFGGSLYQNGVLFTGGGGSSTGTTSTFVISNTTGTISTTTGALQVAGGVGIGGGIVAGGVITGTVHLANGSIAGSTNIGAFTYGTLSYSDNYNLAALQSNNNGYIQLVVQNTNAGTAASSDIVISNNLGTFNTYYGNLGMNSSAFTGVGSFNLPNAVYLASSQGDLVLGSFSLNSIRFALNSAAVDAITISTVSNSIIINNTATITATTASVSTNTGALTVAGGVGIAGGVYIGGSLTATSINTVGAGGGVISGITQLGVSNFTATGIVSISGSISSTVTSTNTASSVSTTTGALVVAGGVGIGGNLNVGGVVTATSLVTTGAGNGIITGVGSISTVNLTASGSITATNIYTVGSGVSTIVGLGLISTIASTVTGLLSVTSSTAATSTSTGAVRIAGGVGVGGSIYSQGMLVTTTSTGIGYTTGSGNTTTQITSRTTPVTVNGLSGYVALFSAAGSTTVASFQVNNPSVLINDVVIVTPRAPTANTYISAANSVTNGSFNISVWASGGVAVEAPIINFAVIKGSIN